ncbi:M48 family metallopeptidase [Bosea sp. TWI1241]|uniref:M48 family metallopeptidase n=1 Tax=Bosea sp. TWI1241 TaxID=3148904 RepID=UPI003209A271
MPAQAFGLYTHQRSNRIRSRLLIAGLFLLVYLSCWGLMLVAYGYGGSPYRDPISDASASFVSWLPYITLATGAWVLIGFKTNVALIGSVTGARGITQSDNPKLFRMLETLCISRGMTTPKLAIIQSDALNAFASGVNDKQFTVTLTSGLIEALSDEELEAVIAHELTHIRNGDVRLMVIAVVIAGVISLVGELMFRGMGRSGFGGSSSSSSSSSSGDRKGGGGAAILIGVAVIAIAWFLAIVVRLSLSRSREYLADAGAVELTKNPDAMISALLKISGRADLDGVPSGVMDMCFENDQNSFADMFSTHPSITKRIQALVEMAGGRMPDDAPHGPPGVGARQPLTEIVETSKAGGPWSRPLPPS